MAFPAKIVYPLPPPTTNCLTPLQRAQLIRSTKKLGRILGTTPHLIDPCLSHALAPLHIDLPFNNVDDRTSSRASTESVSSCSSVKSRTSSYKSGTLSRLGSVRSTTTRSGSLRSRKSKESTDSFDSWPSRKPPMLRLATPPPLATIPASPFLDGTPSIYSHSPSSSIDGHDDQRFTIRPHTSISPYDSPAAPSFTIPSTSSERRNKMERLRRKLGDDVPLDLVFPCEDEPVYVCSPLLEEQELAILSIMPGFQRAPRISSARDSISLDRLHRAQRKIVPPSPLPTAQNGGRDQRQRASVQHNASASLDMREMNAKLCMIAESPSEHGSIREEYGVSRHGAGLESEWYESDDEAEVESWSTMMGVEGWEQSPGAGESRMMSYRQRPMTA